jgi:hypothetical protein
MHSTLNSSPGKRQNLGNPHSGEARDQFNGCARKNVTTSSAQLKSSGALQFT